MSESKKAAERVYLVTGPQGPEIRQRLVKASTANGAIRHAVKQHFSAVIPSQEDLVRLGKAGVEIEQAGSEENGA